ncbi:MAG TPA: hypothetical protein IAA26_06670 [Candidatus Blautia faecipullorum]|nr:hypothetical protein [Candidatus Blautia faecipullorum]
MGKMKKMLLQLFAAKPVRAAAAAQNKFLSYTGLIAFVTLMKNNFAGKSKVIPTTLPASGWSGTDILSNTISAPDVTVDTIVEILVADTASTVQKEAWKEAGIVSGSTGAGKITLQAFGTAPETDIPVTLIMRRD